MIAGIAVHGKDPAHHLAQRVIYLIMKSTPKVLCKFFLFAATRF